MEEQRVRINIHICRLDHPTCSRNTYVVSPTVMLTFSMVRSLVFSLITEVASWTLTLFERKREMFRD